MICVTSPHRTRSMRNVLHESQLHSMRPEIELHVLPPMGGCEPPLATAKIIRDFERAYSIFFPQSYVDFIRAHGPGELNRWVRIHVPRVTKDSMLTLEELIAESGEASDVSLDRFVPFATTGGGDTFYWRFRTPKSNREEQKIYYQERMSEGRLLFSKTFPAFVKSVCAGRRLGIDCENVFQPYGKPLSQSQLSKLVLERRREALELHAKNGKTRPVQNKAVNRSRRSGRS